MPRPPRTNSAVLYSSSIARICRLSRRLEYAQRLRGAAEIAVLDDREEISDLVKLHWSVPVALYSIIEYLLSEKFD